MTRPDDWAAWWTALAPVASFVLGAGILIYETLNPSDRVFLQTLAVALISGTGAMIVSGWGRK